MSDKPPPYNTGYPPQPGFVAGQQSPYQGQNMPPQAGYNPGYGQVYAQQFPQNVVIVGGGCPHCRVGYPREDYSCCGICLAIWFFPIGILCCLAMKETRCSHCGQML
jgi:hypothetical protein